MAGRKRRHVVVRLRAEAGRTDPESPGRSYWLARWTKNGKRDSEPIGWATAEEAEDKRVAIESRLRLGMRPSDGTSSGATVDDVIKAFLRDQGERGLAPRHIENAALRLAQIGRQLGNVPASELTKADLESYIARRRRDLGRVVKGHNVGGGRRSETPARSTVEQEIRILIRAYRTARKLHRIACEPPDWPSFKGWPEDDRPARQLLESEVLALVEAAREERAELARLIEFMAWCPRRPHAIYGIRRKDCARVLDERLPRKHRQLYVARDKGGVKLGWCPLTEPALRVLVEQLEATEGKPDDLVWRSETGRELTGALVWYPFRRACERARLDDVQVYDLRRFAAVRVQEHTRSLSTTCEFSGHRDERTLLRYLSAPRGAAEELAGSIGWSTPAERAAESSTTAPRLEVVKAPVGA